MTREEFLSKACNDCLLSNICSKDEGAEIVDGKWLCTLRLVSIFQPASEAEDNTIVAEALEFKKEIL